MLHLMMALVAFVKGSGRCERITTIMIMKGIMLSSAGVDFVV